MLSLLAGDRRRRDGCVMSGAWRVRLVATVPIHSDKAIHCPAPGVVHLPWSAPLDPSAALPGCDRAGWWDLSWTALLAGQLSGTSLGGSQAGRVGKDGLIEVQEVGQIRGGGIAFGERRQVPLAFHHGQDRRVIMDHAAHVIGRLQGEITTAGTRNP